jgi:thioesterase domain-containing protein
MTRDELRAYLHGHIPLSAAMGVEPLAVSDDEVRLAAPLAPNVNHRGTAFGGSIATLAVLAGWSWLRARLDGREPLPRLVIQQQTVDFVAAATGDLVAVCPAPPPDAWERFLRTLERRRRGRLDLAVEVRSGNAIVARFVGVYAASTDADAAAGGG